MSKLPVKAGTFYPANSDELVSLPAELQAELDDSDKEGYEEAREALPIVSIRQKDKKDEGGRTEVGAGGFKCYDAVFQNLNDVSGEKGLTVSVIMDQPSCIYWKEGQMDHPACRSRDGVTGQGDPGGNCATCPLAQWKQNGDRPECATVMNLLCHDHESSIFYVLSIKRSGLKPYNNLKVLLKRSGTPLHFTTITVKTDYRTEPAPHYVPVFLVTGTLDVTMTRKMKEFRQKLSAAFGKTIETAQPEDDENGNGHTPTQAGDPTRDALLKEIPEFEKECSILYEHFKPLEARNHILGCRDITGAKDSDLIEYWGTLKKKIEEASK